MLVAIEGIDGSGKGTQAARLVERARGTGLAVATFSFPRYGENPFGRAVADFLNGRYGGLDQVAPELAALLFAGDRYATRRELVEALGSHDLVVCDRYMASNLAHQGAKLPATERPRFIAWLQEIELDVYELPPAALTVWLDLPVAAARSLVLEKDARDYTVSAMDIQEADSRHLAGAREVYAHLAAHDASSRWVRVECAGGEQGVRSVDEIAADVWAAVSRARAGDAQSAP